MNNSLSQDPDSIFHEDEGIDFKRYLSLFISNWYWFTIALFITISIAYGINRWSEEIYTVSSTLLIKDDQIGGAGAAAANIFPGVEAFKSQQNLKNEIGILKSYDLNYKVILELTDFHTEYIRVGKRGLVETRMYNRCPFIVLCDSLDKQPTGIPVEIKIISENRYELSIRNSNNFREEKLFGERYTGEGFDFRIIKREPERFEFNSDAPNRYYFYFLNPVAQANHYRSKLSVTPIEEEASLVTLSTSGFVPAQEADYLNTLMDVYIQSGLDYKNKTASQTIDFIEKQLRTISDSLHLAEDDLERFRLVNRLIDISREGVVLQNKLEQLDNEKTALLLRRNYYEYLKEYIDSKKGTGDIISPSVMGISDELLINLVGELSALQQQKNKLAMNLYESSEPLKIIEAEIITARQALQENISIGLLTIGNSLSEAESRYAEIEKEVIRLPTTERQMINIQRKFDINNTVYTFLLEKRAEAGIAMASNVADNRTIDRAFSFNSSRIRPKSKQNYIIALILGLFIPVSGIVIIDYLNNKIIDKKDIEKETRAPIIGFISHNTLKTEIPVRETPGSTLAESFRSVRTNLKYFLRDSNNPVISVTSTITAEGKTFISTNIATIIASLGKKVLLVGLDLRKPRTHKILNTENITGMSNYLAGDCTFGDVVQPSVIENLWYAPSGPVPPNPAELIESSAMKEFITTAREKFDYIIIDTPPVAVVTDALLLSSLTDLYIFVVRQRYTSKNTLGLIEELYRNENIKKLGILVNDISLTGYYGYGLRYGYSGGYGYSYGYNYYGDYKYSNYGYTSDTKGYFSDEESL